MSRVQPPGSPLPFSTPLGADTPGAGQVVSDGLMKRSMAKGLLVKWLVTPCAVSEQSAGCGGLVRFTSFCSRQEYLVPSWATWAVCAAVAFARPSTRRPPTEPHPPYRLSKEWFSS